MEKYLNKYKYSVCLAAALGAAAVFAGAAEPGYPGMGGPRLAAGIVTPPAQEVSGPFSQVALPYGPGDLAPYISEETINYHYGKHYKGNVDALNKLVAGKPEAALSLDVIIMTAPPGPLFNNAAQTWNHAFYFNSLWTGGGGKASGPLAAAIDRDFGSFDKFREAFSQSAQSLFGSGWVWLVLDNNMLKVVQTANADLPMKHGQKALFVLDVWEHAYYIDYRNVRAKYIDAFLDHLVNWNFAGENYADEVALSAARR